MMKVLLPLTGLLASAAIVLSAAVALRGSRPEPPPWARATVIEADEPLPPDTSAAGVIAARAGNQIYLFTPQGERLGIRNATTFSVETSPSGKWQAFRGCPGSNQACQLLLAKVSPAGNLQPINVALATGLRDGLWSPAADLLAALDEDGGLSLVDPVTLKVAAAGKGVTFFAWTASGSLLFTTYDGERAELAMTSDGRTRSLGTLASPVTYMVPSPDRTRFAFVQDGDDGWRLSVVREDGAVHDAANLGRPWTYSPAETRAPDSVAISWSPDARYIAASPVAQPFVMFVMPADGGARPSVHYLKEGYAGEMKWSPDGSRLAVSTYSPDRSQHAIYLLESLDSNQLRFLVDGCIVFWSPDGRFIVNHREPRSGSGLAVTRVEDGYSWAMSRHVVFTPAAWATDEPTALALSDLPARGIGGLGK